MTNIRDFIKQAQDPKHDLTVDAYAQLHRMEGVFTSFQTALNTLVDDCELLTNISLQFTITEDVFKELKQFHNAVPPSPEAPFWSMWIAGDGILLSVRSEAVITYVKEEGEFVKFNG